MSRPRPRRARLGRARARLVPRGRPGRRAASPPGGSTSSTGWYDDSDDEPATPRPGRPRSRRRPGSSCRRSPTRRRSPPRSRRRAGSTPRWCSRRWRRSSPTRSSARTSSARSPTSPPGRPVVRVGDGAAAMPGLDHQAADRDRGAVGARAGDPVRDARGRRRQGPDRAGRRRRPVPGVEAAARTAYPDARRRRDPGRADRRGAAAAGPDQGRGWGTTTRCSPSRRSTRPGRRTTCPSTWSRGSPRSGSTRAGRRSAPAGSTTRRCTPRRPSPPRWSRNGIEVVGAPDARRRRRGGRELASVQSAPLREIVARVLEVSDNEAAEVLSHQVGVAVTRHRHLRGRRRRGGPDAAGARRTDRRASSIHDGSGLSRENLITPLALVGVLRAGARPGAPGAERGRHGAAGRRLHRLADQPVRRSPSPSRAGWCGPRPAR